jgi:large subunit ribosomal protein L13
MKTQFAKKDDIDRKWYVVDAKDVVLGKLATKVATYLRGKNKPVFTPNVDTGDFIIVINADKIRLTGKKVTDKVYYHHSGYIGGIKAQTAKELLEKARNNHRKSGVGNAPEKQAGQGNDKEIKSIQGG